MNSQEGDNSEQPMLDYHPRNTMQDQGPKLNHSSDNQQTSSQHKKSLSMYNQTPREGNSNLKAKYSEKSIGGSRKGLIAAK